MKLKTGKEEIVYLLGKVIEQYETLSGQQIVRNSNRRNYEGVAKALSEISNALPGTAEILKHEPYLQDYNPQKLEYPFRKYDITGNQVKDAYFNHIVSNPRPFLVDACYIYLYGTGRKGFEADPKDENLLKDENSIPVQPGDNSMAADKVQLQPEGKNFSFGKIWLVCFVLVSAALGFTVYRLINTNKKWEVMQQDMRILPYQPTQQEIDSLQGVWLCYTGSPQARSSDSNRYHMVVSNVVDVKYKDGYFVFNRYGASFDHLGYMQFEAPWLVSIHSHVKNNSDSIESPRHSLMRLDKEKGLVSVISASWNFDVGSRNNVIGIREVYIKQGKGGYIEEVMNTIENASCRCKIIKWYRGDKDVKTLYLRNQSLETLQEPTLKTLLDEKSIILRVPQKGLIIGDSLWQPN